MVLVKTLKITGPLDYADDFYRLIESAIKDEVFAEFMDTKHPRVTE